MTGAEKIVLELTVVLFSISYAWMVGERTSSFPKIRRFSAIHELFLYYTSDKPLSPLQIDNIKIFCISWGLLWAGLLVPLSLLIGFSDTLENSTSELTVTQTYIVPFLFLLAPQFISRLISSLVLATCKAEVEDLAEHDAEAFSCYAKAWRKRYGLDGTSDCKTIRDNELNKMAWRRAKSSLFYTLLIYVIIWLFIST